VGWLWPAPPVVSAPATVDAGPSWPWGWRLISVVVGGLHSANSAGGFGTGNGLAGAIVAIGMGLIGMVLAGLALARSRRTAAPLTG
jgi:hypothetical protein